jgi:hypothetical protein
MFKPLSTRLRDAEKRETSVGEVSGLTTTGGGVLGNSWLLPRRPGRGAGDPSPIASSCLVCAGELCTASSSCILGALVSSSGVWNGGIGGLPNVLPL